MSTATTEPGRPALTTVRAYSVVIVSGLMTLILLLEFTLIYPALPRMAQAFQTGAITWSIIIAEITGVVASPLIGMLGDLYGIKRVFLTVAAVFVLGSLICATAQHLAVLLAGRAMQGMALGLINITYSIVRNVLSRRVAAIGLGVISSIVGIAFIIGPLLSSVLVGGAGWRGLFIFCALYMAVVGILFARIVPESGVRRHCKPDVRGAVLLCAALALLFIPISEGGSWGWHSALTLGSLGLGAAALIVFIVRALHSSEPLVDLRVLGMPQVRIPILVQVACNWPATMMSVMLPMLLLAPRSDLGYGFGITGASITLYYLPHGLSTILFGPAIGALVRRGHGMLLLRISTVSYALALTVLAFEHADTWGMLLGTGIAGIGHGAAYSAVGYLVADAAPADQRGAATGIMGATGIFAGGIGTATLACILAAHVTGYDSFHAPIYSNAAFVNGFLTGVLVAMLGLVQTFIGRSSGVMSGNAKRRRSIPTAAA